MPTEQSLKAKALVNIVALQNGLTLASVYFPEKSSVVRELFTTDHQFRDLCDDYALSCVSIARFQSLTDVCAGNESPNSRKSQHGFVTRLRNEEETDPITLASLI